MNKIVFLFTTIIILMLFSGCVQQGGEIPQSTDVQIQATETPTTKEEQVIDPTTTPTSIPVPTATPIPTPEILAATIKNTYPINAITEYTKSYDGVWVVNQNGITGTITISKDKAIYAFTIDTMKHWGIAIETRPNGSDSTLFHIYGEALIENGFGYGQGPCSPYNGKYVYDLEFNLYNNGQEDILTISDLLFSHQNPADGKVHTAENIYGIPCLENVPMHHLSKDDLQIRSLYNLYNEGQGPNNLYCKWEYPSYMVSEESDIIITKNAEIVDTVSFPSGIEMNNVSINKDYFIGTIINPNTQYGPNVYIYLRAYVLNEDGTHSVKVGPRIGYRIDLSMTGSTKIDFPMKVYANDIYTEEVDGFIIGLVSLDPGIYDYNGG